MCDGVSGQTIGPQGVLDTAERCHGPAVFDAHRLTYRHPDSTPNREHVDVAVEHWLDAVCALFGVGSGECN